MQSYKARTNLRRKGKELDINKKAHSFLRMSFLKPKSFGSLAIALSNDP